MVLRGGLFQGQFGPHLEDTGWRQLQGPDQLHGQGIVALRVGFRHVPFIGIPEIQAGPRNYRAGGQGIK